MFSIFLFSLTTAALASVSTQDIQGFNNILSLAVAPASYIIRKEINAAGLDPLQQAISGTQTAVQSIGICKANTEVNYNISNIKGLSTLTLNKVDIVNAQKSDDGSVRLNLEATILPLDLKGFIDGSLRAECGFFKPAIKINGELLAERVDLGFQLEAIASPTPNHEWKLDLKINNVKTDFKDVVVHLKGFNTIFNPLIDFVMRAVENSFKKKIESLLDTEIKDNVNALIQDQMQKLYQSL